jgi:hypothetical protein
MNKRLIILFSLLIVIVLIIVLNSTLFIVKDISTSYPECDKFTANDIISASSIVKDKNIFMISKEKSINIIEKSIPYVEVINIEKKFPNKIIIHTDLRIPIMVIKIDGTDRYLLIDKDLKVLNIINANAINDYCLIRGNTVKFSGNDEEIIGGFIQKDTEEFKNLTLIVETILSLNTAFIGPSFNEYFKSIDFYDENNEGIITISVKNDSNKYFEIKKDSIVEDLQKALSSEDLQ